MTSSRVAAAHRRHEVARHTLLLKAARYIFEAERGEFDMIGHPRPEASDHASVAVLPPLILLAALERDEI